MNERKKERKKERKILWLREKVKGIYYASMLYYVKVYTYWDLGHTDFCGLMKKIRTHSLTGKVFVTRTVALLGFLFMETKFKLKWNIFRNIFDEY